MKSEKEEGGVNKNNRLSSSGVAFFIAFLNINYANCSVEHQCQPSKNECKMFLVRSRLVTTGRVSLVRPSISAYQHDLYWTRQRCSLSSFALSPSSIFSMLCSGSSTIKSICLGKIGTSILQGWVGNS